MKPVKLQFYQRQCDRNLSTSNRILRDDIYPAELQKAIALKITNFKNTFAHLKDILRVKKDTKETRKH